MTTVFTCDAPGCDAAIPSSRKPQGWGCTWDRVADCMRHWCASHVGGGATVANTSPARPAASPHSAPRRSKPKAATSGAPDGQGGLFGGGR